MSAATHHFRVMLRLLGTTRGGLVAMLVLVNCVPMVAMSMFVAGAEHRFAYGYTLETFAFSLSFAPLSRWALGLAVGRHAGRTTAVGLPLSPRGRALAEVAAVVVALWVPAVSVTVVSAIAAGVAVGSELGDVVASLATLCAAVSALALPHLMLASLDREAAYSHRIWIRWLAAPSLIALGLALPATRSLIGYVGVGLGAAAVIAAWGSVSWLGSAPRRAPLALPVDARAVTRLASDGPETMLRRDFWAGLGVGAMRGGIWAVALVGPLVALRWWRTPELAMATALVVAAVVAGGFPLGLRARVVGGRWANNGDFARAWSTLPIPSGAITRAVYLHIVVCSSVVLIVAAAAVVLALTRVPATPEVATTGALLAVVVGLALVGIRTNAAVGTRGLWQFSWLVGGSAVACAWLSRFAFDAPQHSSLSTGFAMLAITAAVIVSLSPASLMRARQSLVPSHAMREG